MGEVSVPILHNNVALILIISYVPPYQIHLPRRIKLVANGGHVFCPPF